MMKPFISTLKLSVLLLCAACPDKDSETTETTATNDTAGTSGTSGTSPTEASEPTSSTDAPGTTGSTGPGEATTESSETEGGTTTASQEPFDVMDACMVAAVCAPYQHEFAESEPETHQDGLPAGEACIFAGLREGTPGRFTYTTSHEFGNGHEDKTYIMHVHADRKVTFATRAVLDLDFDRQMTVDEDAVTCTLAAGEFFDGCLTGSDGDADIHYECAWTDLWWTDCAAMGPMCE